MTETPTLPQYPKPGFRPVNHVPILQNHKSQAPLVSVVKKLSKNMKLLEGKKRKDPFKKRKKARVI